MKLCSKCGELKPEDGFSLLRGKHSNDRKSFCVQCEGLIRRAKTYRLSLDQMNALLARPCSVCGKPAKHIDRDSDHIYGVLCRRCWGFLKSVLPTDDDDIVLACYNYLVFRKKFPFWLERPFESYSQNEPKPLIDWIERNE